MPERPNTAKEYAGSLQKWCFLGMLWLFFCIPVLKAQENASLEKVVIGDNRFILHTVQKSETLYSIAKTYDCTQEEVLGANKNITGIIKKGMILKIPDHTYQKPQLSKVDENRFFRHQVVSGDNYYQLKLRYDVEEEELLKYNPALKEGLKAGMILLIPKKNGQAETPAATPVRTEKAPEVAAVPSPAKPKNMGQPLNIGVYLPLSANVTDSTKLSAKTLSFLSFYQGMLMAADQLSQSGIKTRLYVYDTEKPGSAPGNLAKKPEFANLDLIIGPVYPEAQGAVAEAANLHHLPMVSPLSPDDQWTRKFPLYFQLNPVRKARINATADYIWKEFSQEKVWLLEMEGKSQETREIHSLLEKKGARTGHNGNLASYNIWSGGVEGIEASLKADRPNLFVLAETSEAYVSIAMNRLTLLSKKFPLILIGIQEFTRMQSIETENLHNVNLRYLANTFIDYSRPEVTGFIDRFKVEFGTEPSSYAFQGYDTFFAFVQTLGTNGNVRSGTSSQSNSGLLNSTFHFSRASENGGLSNDRYFIVEYTPGYDVQSLGTFPAN